MRPARKLKAVGRQRLNGIDGVDFVRCRVCGDHRRVISARHLSKHDTDRETYMEEYELSPDELIAKDFRRIQSSRRGYHPYGKRDWVRTIKKLYRAEGDIFAGRPQRERRHLYLLGVWLFGNWNNALRAAGFDPQSMRRRTSWNRDSVIEKIRVLRHQNEPLFPKYVMRNHQNLFGGALREYGSWTNALAAAGIARVPRKTRLGLLRDLRDLMQHSSGSIPQPLKRYLTHYFGSVQNAQAALKTDPKLLSGWSKPKIAAMLARKHRARETLAYATARRDFPALVTAAEKYFGNWGNALYAAKIDPNLYFARQTWRRLKR